MKRHIFDPQKSGKSMCIVCFISGSGTNYREIAARDPGHDYLVFTNRPGCAGIEIARKNKHEVLELSHIPYLKGAREKYGPGKVPRNCAERVSYEQDVAALIEKRLGKQPDLICLAGFDLWFTDWTIDRYFPRILNVHPGDTTLGYVGLHWVPAARAIIAGDSFLRSTLFIADKSEDNGPILAQSAPVDIRDSLAAAEESGQPGLTADLDRLKEYIHNEKTSSFDEFKTRAPAGMQTIMSSLCSRLQDALKVQGDWKVYPFAVHDLIARGRVEIEGRAVFVDGRQMPVYGYRPDENC